MKKLTLLFLLIAFAAHSQNTRVIYQYKYVPNSSKADSIKTEWMYLDIDKEGSKYYSKKKFDNDSIQLEIIKKQISLGGNHVSISQNHSSGDVLYSVEKKYPDYQTYLFTSIDNDNFKVLEDRKIQWAILKDVDKIETYNVQKATTNFAGRQWTAWFTTEIPIQDGPYKFYGLPGLILKIEDTTKSHSIIMKGIKKFQAAENVALKSDKIPDFYNRKPLEVSRKQYLIQLEKYQKDPVQGMREMLKIPNSKVKINVNGQEFSDPKDVLREMEKAAKQEMSEDNNQIELKP
jgi:GLPGLI family protein